MNYKIYDYKYQNVPILNKYNAREILKGVETVSLDLGITKEKVEIEENKIIIRGVTVEKSVIEKISKDNGTNIFFVFEDGVKKALFFDEKVYKLRLVKPDTAPTLEINGIHMHKIKKITPWEDAQIKISSLEPTGKVLDICTGLGYTAILESKKAEHVTTIELDKNVLFLAEYNPWSKELEKENIEIILSDAVELVKDFEEEKFDRIMHDPPRGANILYSRPFYSELYRVLKKDGYMLHYVGSPKRREFEFYKQVIRRLQEVGFKFVKYIEEIESILVRK